MTDGSIWEDWDDAPLTVEHDSGGNYWYTQPVGSPFIGCTYPGKAPNGKLIFRQQPLQVIFLHGLDRLMHVLRQATTALILLAFQTWDQTAQA